MGSTSGAALALLLQAMLRCYCRLRVSILTADTSPDRLYQRDCSRNEQAAKSKLTFSGGKHADNDMPTQSHHYLQKRNKTSYKTKVESVSDARWLTYSKLGLIKRHYFQCFLLYLEPLNSEASNQRGDLWSCDGTEMWNQEPFDGELLGF